MTGEMTMERKFEIPVNRFSRPQEKNGKPTKIVLTDAMMPGRSAEDVARYMADLQKTGSEYFSAHHIVDSSGPLSVVPESEIAPVLSPREGKNSGIISVVVCTGKEGAVSDELQAKLSGFLSALLKKSGLKKDSIKARSSNLEKFIELPEEEISSPEVKKEKRGKE